jgi:hypothetical protein
MWLMKNFAQNLCLVGGILLSMTLSAQTNPTTVPVSTLPAAATNAPQEEAAPTPTANNPALRGFDAGLDAVLTANDPGVRNRAVIQLLQLQHQIPGFLEYAARSSVLEDALKQGIHDALTDQAEQARTDEQFSPGPNAGGTVSSVAKASLASLLSAAIDSGAITQALNGNTANLSGNAYGVLRFLAGSDPFLCAAPSKDQMITKKFKGCGTRILKDLGFTLSFDMNQATTKTAATSPPDNPAGTPSSVNLLTGHNRFSGASVKYVFSNPRDVRSKQFQQDWAGYYNTNREKFQTAGASLLTVLDPVLNPVFESQPYRQNLAAARQDLATRFPAAPPGRAELEQWFAKYLETQLTQARSAVPDFDDKVKKAYAAFQKFLGTADGLLETITRHKVFSAEYDFERPQGQPELSRFRVMSTFNPFGPKGTLSINAAGTLYNSSSVSAQFGRWRDAQAAIELERTVAGDLVHYPAKFGLSGYFQYMISPGLISLDSGNLAPGTSIPLPQSAAVALAPTGPIWIAEAKVTFKLKNSGAEIPIAITRSNRTDLIKATSTRGHVGISYDLDKLFTNK